MITGTIKNQVHLQALDQKWQQKKQELFSPQKDKSEMTHQERMLADFQEQAENIRKHFQSTRRPRRKRRPMNGSLKAVRRRKRWNG